MASPILDAIEAEPDRWDTSSLISVSSSAALFSQTNKDRFLELFPNLIITDAIGSTESGMNGMTYAQKGHKATAGGPTVQAGADVVVLDEELKPIPEGDDQIGKLGRGGNIPLGLLQRSEEDGRDVRDRRPTAGATPSRAISPSGPATARSRCSGGARCRSTPAARRSSPKRSSRPSRHTPPSSTASWSVSPTSAGASASPRSSASARARTRDARRPGHPRPHPGGGLQDPPRAARRRLRSCARRRASPTIPWAKQLAESGDRTSVEP